MIVLINNELFENLFSWFFLIGFKRLDNEHGLPRLIGSPCMSRLNHV